MTEDQNYRSQNRIYWLILKLNIWSEPNVNHNLMRFTLTGIYGKISTTKITGYYSPDDAAFNIRKGEIWKEWVAQWHGAQNQCKLFTLQTMMANLLKQREGTSVNQRHVTTCMQTSETAMKTGQISKQNWSLKSQIEDNISSF